MFYITLLLLFLELVYLVIGNSHNTFKNALNGFNGALNAYTFIKPEMPQRGAALKIISFFRDFLSIKKSFNK